MQWRILLMYYLWLQPFSRHVEDNHVLRRDRLMDGWLSWGYIYSSTICFYHMVILKNSLYMVLRQLGLICLHKILKWIWWIQKMNEYEWFFIYGFTLCPRLKFCKYITVSAKLLVMAKLTLAHDAPNCPQCCLSWQLPMMLHSLFVSSSATHNQSTVSLEWERKMAWQSW